MWRTMADPSNIALPHRRWAVTGATGLVGNNLVRTLVARGATVRVLARKAPRREFEGLDVEQIDGDLDDSAALARCFEGADCVVHSAAMVDIRYGGRDAMTRVNVGGTKSVLDAIPNGARFVHVSTVDAIGLAPGGAPANEDTPCRPEEEGVPYVDTKRAADRLVLASAADYVIVYPTYMLGPWDWKPSSGRMILEIAKGKGAFAPGGGNNFVYIGDVVDALITAAGKQRGGRWILGNQDLSYREAWSLMAEVTGARKPFAALPNWMGSLAAGALSAANAIGLPEGDINAASTAMSFIPHYFDASRARTELGMRQTPISTAIAEAWAWFRANGYTGSDPTHSGPANAGRSYAKVNGP